MYKLKNSYIDRMIQEKISNGEIAFILHIAVSQDESGRVHSVYYKDVCEALNISIQTFYDILKSLSDKKLIFYEKQNPADFVVQLIGNDFSGQDFSKGYLNVASKDFRNSKFVRLKAGAKLLYLYTQRFTAGKHMFVKNFYDTFCKLFQVTHKTLQIYLQQLKEAKYLFVSKKRNKAYNYEMTMKRSSCLDKKDGNIPHEKVGYIMNVAQLIRCNFSRYFKDKNQECEEHVLWDIAKLADSKRAKRYHNFISLIVAAVRASIQLQKNEKKSKIVVNAALVNKCLSDTIERLYLGRSLPADQEIVRLLTDVN